MRAPAATDAAPLCMHGRGAQPPPCLRALLWAQRAPFSPRGAAPRPAVPWASCVHGHIALRPGEPAPRRDRGFEPAPPVLPARAVQRAPAPDASADRCSTAPHTSDQHVLRGYEE